MFYVLWWLAADKSYNKRICYAMTNDMTIRKLNVIITTFLNIEQTTYLPKMFHTPHHCI